MRVNWRKFWTTFGLLYAVVFIATFASGCAGILATISGLLPALEAAIMAAVSFAAALEGKTVSPTLSTTVKQWGNNVAGLIANIQSIIAAAAGQATAGVIAQIQAVMSQIQSSITSILGEFNVTDGATVSKFTSLLGLGVALVQTILGLFPVAQALISRSGLTDEQLKAEAQEASNHVKSAHKSMQDAYVVIRNTPTDNSDVNVALGTLPTALP